MPEESYSLKRYVAQIQIGHRAAPNPGKHVHRALRSQVRGRIADHGRDRREYDNVVKALRLVCTHCPDIRFLISRIQAHKLDAFCLCLRLETLTQVVKAQI